MKKRRKILLESIEYLSNEEKKKLVGGEDLPTPTIPPTVNISIPPPPTTLPVTVGVNPFAPGVTVGRSFNF